MDWDRATALRKFFQSNFQGNARNGLPSERQLDEFNTIATEANAHRPDLRIPTFRDKVCIADLIMYLQRIEAAQPPKPPLRQRRRGKSNR